MAVNTNINIPYSPFIDPATGRPSQEWLLWLMNPKVISINATNALGVASGGTGTSTIPANGQLLIGNGSGYTVANLTAGNNVSIANGAGSITINADVLAPDSNTLLGELQKNIQAAALGGPSMPQLGTLAAENADNVRLIGFSTNPSPAVPNPAPTGTLYWDGNSTLGLQMNQNVLAKIGQAQFVYVKASSAITKGQLCYHTGAVGGSGVITAAPTLTNMTNPTQIVGVAAESIALNGFGFIQTSGDLRGFNTTGSSVGEVWADGDSLYYNPNFVGSLTNVKPSAPSMKTYVGEVINAGSGSSGSINVHIVYGSQLGGTDSNVQFGALSNGDLIQYDSVAGYWKNVASSAISIGTATNLGGGVGGSIPYQSAASTTTFLGIGTNNYVLTSNGSIPGWTANTGTGNVVRATSPSLTTPDIGTPTAGVLTSCTGLPLTTGVTGTLGTTNGGTGLISFTNAGVVYASSTSALTTGTGLQFNGTNLGVGASPLTLIYGYSATSSILRMDGDSTTQFITYRASSSAAGPGWFLRKSRGTIASPSAVNSGDLIGSIQWSAYGGTNFRITADIRSYIDTYVSDTNLSSYLSFYTCPTGSSTATERIRITGLGNVYNVAGGSTGMTDNFFYIPAAAGAPTGVPTAIANTVPMYYDTTNNKFYIYNGAWKSVALL